MKVLQVIDTLKLGGAERMLISLSNILYKKGVNISVLLIKAPHFCEGLLTTTDFIAII